MENSFSEAMFSKQTVWRSGSALVSINDVNLRRARYVWPCPGRLPRASLYFGM